jgi:chromosome segregation protein
VFLKSVELFGFKSFADRSLIEFRDGISALLGPNGCGKSNVVDAVKWVLGEQSTRSLRADRMEDIIFNGTESRKAVNVAEVTLTLANEDGFLPIDMPEISVKRRLHRSGESEYFINGTPAKLKEVRELFFDTGIGKSAYSIMEQGKIDQVLSNRPEERRYLFEEAAGITKYKIRGAEAERKLGRTEENMKQVENILREVKRSYNSLKTQSEKTEKYREYKERIFELELDLRLLKLKELSSSQNEKEEKLRKKKQERDELKSSIDGINESLEENLDKVNSMESDLIEKQKKLYGLDIEQNNQRSQQNLLKERLQELGRHIESAERRERTIRDKITSIKEAYREKEEQVRQYAEQLKEIDGNIEEFTSSVDSARSRISRNEEQAEKIEKNNKRLEQENREYQKKLHAITDDIVAELDNKLKETGYSYARRRETEEKIRSSLEQIVIQVEGKHTHLNDVRSTSAEDPRQLGEAVDKAYSALGEMREKAEALRSLFEQYLESIPSFIDEFLAPEGIITQKREIDEEIESRRSAIEENTAELEKLRQENKELSSKIEEYRGTLEELRVGRMQVETQRKAAEEQLETFTAQIREQEELLEENRREIENNKKQIKETGRKIQTIREELESLQEREQQLRSTLEELEANISKRNKELKNEESTLKKRMDYLGKVQEQVEKLQMEAASVKTEIKGLYDAFRDAHSRDLGEYESRMFDIARPAKELRQELQDVKSKLKDLGQVNLMAPEEFAEVKERHDFLTSQLEDLQKAREDLQRITREIETESTELFLTTYDQIRKNFHSMFRRLFGGGRGELKLTDPDNVLESGIEIFAQPPGKSLENIALLSGGERSLTAVALLFATYMVKPSPFCVLDEIDAALDESNVGRFINLLIEFSSKSQFIIITHNKKTVAGAKTLLGITMEESGISKVIAVRLAENGHAVEVDEEGSEVPNGVTLTEGN